LAIWDDARRRVNDPFGEPARQAHRGDLRLVRALAHLCDEMPDQALVGATAYLPAARDLN
jgi:hypothetical protein